MLGNLPRSPGEPSGTADDVALACADDGALWVCASWSALDAEEVWLGVARDDGLAAMERIGDDGPCFRPAVAAGRGGVVAVALAPRGAVFGLVRRDDRAPERWRIDVAGRPWHASLALDEADGEPWLALEVHHARRRAIRIGRLDARTGAMREVATIDDARWPALVAAPGGGCLVAWVAGGRVHVARVDAATGAATGAAAGLAARDVGAGDAPALAVRDERAVIAWHVGGALLAVDDREASVRRTLQLARWDLASDVIAMAPEPPAGAGDLDPRGEDQGWELPAVAIDSVGGVWLAGRSSHGHQLARLDGDDCWSARVSLCRDDWGGRGRRLALATRGAEVWVARRAPDGIEVRACERPGGEAPSPRPLPSRSPRATPRSSAVLFGDLHQHTAHSDGCGSAEDLWAAARARGLDFAAITDHDRFCRRALGPATWDYLCQLAHDADEPGRFAAFPGYEFTGVRHPGPGHKCVYFGDRVPDRVPDKDVDAIFAVCRELGGIAVPHHVGWTGGDFAHHDPALQPVWEICSVHGCYAGPGGCGAHLPRADHVIPGQFVRDALDAGLRFGFIGSTDSHGLDWHHGIARWRNPFRSGLACVVGAEATRVSIFDAIRARRTYATSGACIGLRVEVDGAPLGSELPAGTRGEIVVEVDGTAPIARLVLVTPDREIVLGGGASARIAARAPVPEDAPYFYVRVEQEDREMAWASPFFVG